VEIAYGTAIATFSGDRYSGHAAIYVSQNRDGIHVYDQVYIDNKIVSEHGGS
jgi:hypothetical protein